MAYLVVAIGVLMSLIGLFAAISGYPIIEVERGWAAVISGSTLLAGGFVTIALGLVLKTLVAIKGALDARPAEALTTADQTPHFEPTLRGVATGALVAPAFAEALASDHESSWLETMHAETTPAEPPAPTREMPRDHALDHEHYEPALDEPAFQASAFSDPAINEPAHQTVALHEPEAPELPHHADAYELQSPSTPAHDLTPFEHEPAPPAPAPSADDDWLDRAFSDLDRELAVGGHPTRTAPVDAAPAETPLAPIEEHAPPPVEHAAPETAPALDTPSLTESAVIGRYESEGTSYVMFADGSIEAQSEAGIYRFKSMAELKSFIEG